MRKPNSIQTGTWRQAKAEVHKYSRYSEYPIYISSSLLTLQRAKKLHSWLGRAIQYLEQEKGKKS